MQISFLQTHWVNELMLISLYLVWKTVTVSRGSTFVQWQLTTVVIILTFFLFFILNFVLGDCVDPYVFDNTSKTCLQLITDQLLNRSDADNYCKMDGGALVTIDTSAKQTALEGYLDSLGGKSGQMLQVFVLVFNVTFNNIPGISRRSNVTCSAA